MKPLIQAAEVWTPDESGQQLVLADGLYADAVEFASSSRGLRFARGEGLPGRTWSAGRPIVLKNLQHGFFQRPVAAKAAGLTCAVGVPVYAADTSLKAVVVLFCGTANWGAGAIELWRARENGGLTLVDGYYGSTTAEFEASSRSARIEIGKGLPGEVMTDGAMVFAADLADGRRFIRQTAAAEAGLRYGLAIPCGSASGETFVLVFLSSEATPIAMRLEAWGDGRSDGLLSRTFGFCGIDGRLAEGGVPAGGEAAIRMALATDTPQVLRRSQDDAHEFGQAMGGVAQGLLALAVPRPNGNSQVMALYL